MSSFSSSEKFELASSTYTLRLRPAFEAPSWNVFKSVLTLSPIGIFLHFMGPFGPVYNQCAQQMPPPASLVLKKNVDISGAFFNISVIIPVYISCVSFTLVQGAKAFSVLLLG